MRPRGAEDPAVDPLVAGGANASLPHAHAGGRRIGPGKMLLVDFGARRHRYNSDTTRTLWADSMPSRWRRRYEAVLAAQQAAVQAIRPGVAGSVPDQAAREALAGAGLEGYFTHGLGHGVGLAVHEDPRLSRSVSGQLVVGNVVTVEPGVYFPGAGGIRIEDMALVTADGVQVLGTLPKDADSVVF
ncbi:MAG: M24 family metallopeptidase, partial [Planctomycetes bacterium]|nr:M24 family metallopeptidase [Planctomycetota bacterium]